MSSKSHPVDNLPHRYSLLAGKKVLITAGPTREYWDPVRFISNGSSGQTGLALAREAKRLGAEVTLILGPIPGPRPEAKNIGKIVSVVSAMEMDAAVQEYLPGTQVFVGAAAVSDYRPAKAAKNKMKDKDELISLILKRNPDIITKVARRSPTRPPNVIGFALETENLLANAREKLMRKGLDWIVANNEGNVDNNTASGTLISRWGEQIPLGRMSKGRLAEKIWYALLSRPAL
jgi:phosphopantothenoylcysteine decarboxylase / phosphopantothenate---cysteine ligase